MEKSILNCSLRAAPYVFRKLPKCLFRGLPYLLILAPVWYYPAFIYTKPYITPLAIGIFIVSWCRFTAGLQKGEDREFPYGLGPRELKVAVLLFTMFFIQSQALNATFLILKGTSSLSLLSYLSLPVTIAVGTPLAMAGCILFPAIALDQPLKLRKYFDIGRKGSGYFLLTIVAVYILFSIMGFAFGNLAFFIDKFSLLETYQISRNNASLFIAVLHGVPTIIIWGILISASTIYFRETIGLEEQT